MDLSSGDGHSDGDAGHYGRVKNILSAVAAFCVFGACLWFGLGPSSSQLGSCSTPRCGGADSLDSVMPALVESAVATVGVSESSDSTLAAGHTSGPHSVPSELVPDATSETKSVLDVSDGKNKLPLSTRPKVVLIVDDIASRADYNGVASLGLVINPAFFPRQEASPDTPDIAKYADFYMIHLPLQAYDFYQNGVRYINKGASEEEIDRYVMDIKRDFPNVKYVNNHTGSLYTSSRVDMERLVHVLRKHGIKFVDSRTTPDTVAKDLVGGIYLHRDVFLDNKQDEVYIESELKRALRIADSKGYVVMQAHPRHASISVLRKYRELLNSRYHLIRLDELDSILGGSSPEHDLSKTASRSSAIP